MSTKTKKEYIKLANNDVETRLSKKGTRYVAEEKADYCDEPWITIAVFTKGNLSTLTKAMAQAKALAKAIESLQSNQYGLLDTSFLQSANRISSYIENFEVIIYDGGDKVTIGCKMISEKELAAILKL